MEVHLAEERTCRDFRQVRTEGARQVTRSIPHYNLDLIISLGYRARSAVATQFRSWATERLREYLVKCFTIDDAKHYLESVKRAQRTVEGTKS